jgi:hypothetical protein
MAQRTLMAGDSDHGLSTVAVRTYPDPSGGRVTENIYVILEAEVGSALRVQAMAGGLSTTREVVAGDEARPDAGTDDLPEALDLARPD